MGLMADLERRRPGRPKQAGPVRATVIAMRGSIEWKAWLDIFADHCHLGLADTVEQSLLCYAKERNFQGPPNR